MADDKTASSSSRKTMAPASKDPAGVDDKALERGDADDGRTWVDDLSADELDDLESAVKRARLRLDRTPREPSFGISEGERQELENTGRTVSPFTGERRGDWSRQDPRGRVRGG